MPLLPKRVKHRKVQKGKRRGKAYRGCNLNFGSIGIKAMECGWITSRQIEAARIAITRHVKRGGKLWITIFPDKPITKKPAEVRMGKGKGAPEFWVAVVKPGRILFEMDGIAPKIAREAFERAIHKLPIKCKIVELEEASGVLGTVPGPAEGGEAAGDTPATAAATPAGA